MRLANKVILITASTRGIGLACVKACAKEGAIVYMAARNLEAAEKTANELNAQGYHVKYVYNDAAKPDTFLSMVDEVVENEGHLDVLVNNFGISNPQKDWNLDEIAKSLAISKSFLQHQYKFFFNYIFNTVKNNFFRI